MTRVRIDDLPPEDENLTPEELEQIEGGAGRRSFRPTLEGLENREMYAVNLGHAGPLPQPGPAILRQQLNELPIQQGQDQLGTKDFTQDGYRYVVRTFKDANDTFREIQVFDRSGGRIFRGI